jgi:arylsulfatase A-like enzyme
VHVPWLTGTHGEHTNALVEMIDVFPTLSDLAGLASVPVGVEGRSFAPMMRSNGLVPLVNATFKSRFVLHYRAHHHSIHNRSHMTFTSK